MPLSPTQLISLKAELTNDPRGYGYAADLATGNDSGLVAKLNLPRDGTNGGQAIRTNNATADTGAIRAAITKAAYDGLAAGDRTWINWLTGAGSITVGPDSLQTLAGVPTANGSVWSTTTRAAMNPAMEAILRRTGSRAEELFGVTVTESDVIAAKNLP
jgi:hypothetical protein